MRRPAVARAILATKGRPAVYTAPGGSGVSTRAVVRDVDREIRLTRGTDLAASDAVAAVDEALAPRRGATLACEGSEYEIAGILRSSVPGLVDLGLVRLKGPGVEIRDLSGPILRAHGETVEIDGHEVRAAVNRSGLFIEEDKWGNAVEAVRHVVGISLADAEGVRPGSIVRLDGSDRLVMRVLRDGLGMVRVVL